MCHHSSHFLSLFNLSFVSQLCPSHIFTFNTGHQIFTIVGLLALNSILKDGGNWGLALAEIQQVWLVHVKVCYQPLQNNWVTTQVLIGQKHIMIWFIDFALLTIKFHTMNRERRPKLVSAFKKNRIEVAATCNNNYSCISGVGCNFVGFTSTIIINTLGMLEHLKNL